MSYTTNDYSDCSPVLREFLFYMLNIKGRSALTVDNYYMDLRTFFRFIKQHKEKVPKDVPFEQIDISDVDIALISSISLSDVYEFLNFLSQERQNSARTRSRKVCAIRMFFKYLTHNVNLLENNPVEYLELPSTPKSLPKHLTLEQSFDLLSACLLYTSPSPRDS